MDISWTNNLANNTELGDISEKSTKGGVTFVAHRNLIKDFISEIRFSLIIYVTTNYKCSNKENISNFPSAWFRENAGRRGLCLLLLARAGRRVHQLWQGGDHDDGDEEEHGDEEEDADVDNNDDDDNDDNDDDEDGDDERHIARVDRAFDLWSDWVGRKRFFNKSSPLSISTQ